MVSLKEGKGKVPVDKEQLIMAKMSGPTVWNTAFKKQVGMQSERQVDDFESAIVRSRVDREISVKRVKVESGQESTTISLKSVLKFCRISNILFTKWLRNSSHLSGKDSTGWLGGGNSGIMALLGNQLYKKVVSCFSDCTLRSEH